MESFVFSDLLIKFFQNKGNYLNRLQLKRTQSYSFMRIISHPLY